MARRSSASGFSASKRRASASFCRVRLKLKTLITTPTTTLSTWTVEAISSSLVLGSAIAVPPDEAERRGSLGDGQLAGVAQQLADAGEEARRLGAGHDAAVPVHRERERHRR